MKCEECGHLLDSPMHQLGCVDACGIRDDFDYYDWLDRQVEEEKDKQIEEGMKESGYICTDKTES